MLEFMKTYFPKLLAFIVAILIFLGILPKDYDPFEETTAYTIVLTETEQSTDPIVVDPSQDETSVSSVVPEDPDDPSTWSTAAIVEFYKAAAAKTDKTTCQSHSEMQTISLKNVPSILENTVKNAINNKKENRDGITGGHDKLEESDLLYASARKYGSNKVIISMIPKDQTDGAYGKESEGTVGHLVYVVNGVEQLLSESGMNGNFNEDDVRLDYKHAYANNIIINLSTGLIESGTWGYEVYAYIYGGSVGKISLPKNIEAVIKYTVTFPA